jgi:hypothetical protein
MVRSRLVLSVLVAASFVGPSDADPQRRPGLGGGGRRQPVPAGEDEKSGPIEIKAVRMKQGTSGSYVTSGGSYNVKAGTPVDFEVEWKAEKPISETPQLTIDWGRDGVTSTTCGLCRLSRSIPEGTHAISLRIDDRKGGVTRRSFVVIAAKR